MNLKDFRFSNLIVWNICHPTSSLFSVKAGDEKSGIFPVARY